MSFDFKIREGNHNFGYIFRLLGEKGTTLDLVISELKETKKLSLIYSAKSILQIDESDGMLGLDFDTWNQARVSISSGTISLSLNELSKTTNIPTGKFIPQHLYFGTNQDANYFTTDVPPMTIKNVRIFNKDEQETAFWPLDKHAGDTTYDAHRKLAALAQHPKWEIDGHYCWEKKQTLTFEVYP
ncbi:hypothetical protein [Bacteroides sp. 224]|uniref:hypothetical protein n=1 Tax=Bacteroides sp. 224 TaxID=2302936 RepID=UPI0013D42166|nr:hypothetical protein [Bacteroides sp. 224]